MALTASGDNTYLSGIRVLEMAGEAGEYAGKLLAGLGADVVKVEPSEGEATRANVPFVDDVPDPDQSLFFWHYNVSKRSVVIDLEDAEGRRSLQKLIDASDVVLEDRPRGYLESRGITFESSSPRNPGLIWSRITPFGDDGPWKDYKANDLVHLALGGVTLNCGYDPDPDGTYTLPPITPQMMQSYHIAGEMAVMALLAALLHRSRTGEGQRLDLSVHDAVSKNTETDLPDWIFARHPHYRQTCRHSFMTYTENPLARTLDGRWLLAYNTYLKGMDDGWKGTLSLLRSFGMQADFEDAAYLDREFRATPHVVQRLQGAVARVVGRLKYADEVWKKAQEFGLAWSPVRRPEENLADPHLAARGTYVRIEHEEVGKRLDYVWRRWVDEEGSWGVARRPPKLGEHTHSVDWGSRRRDGEQRVSPGSLRVSKRDKPFALQGLRVIDLSWIVASAGAGRFLAAYGAEVIKVEHHSRWDGLRWGAGTCPEGGREARDAATSPMETIDWDSPNRSGAFADLNAGKLGVSLNLKSAEGKKILERLLEKADVLIEGFSPGTLERMGFGYEKLRKLNPRLVYVQQSGFGQYGVYGRMRAFGPTAQAFSGLSEMSGMPHPYQPAGIGYSYLDWFGAYNVANAVLAALFRRERTDEGCHIDASQVEIGAYLTGSTTLDYQVNGRVWNRSGNRSTTSSVAPHGVFPADGEDRWVAIACQSEADWQRLVEVLGSPEWALSEKLRSMQDRIEHQEELEERLAGATATWDPYELVSSLQQAGVRAGVVQSAQDRYERDPQLEFDGWLVELDQQEIGTWPIKEVPGELSRTPGVIGGPMNRAAPSYGEDTDHVLKEILGLSERDLDRLRTDAVIA